DRLFCIEAAQQRHGVFRKGMNLFGRRIPPPVRLSRQQGEAAGCDEKANGSQNVMKSEARSLRTGWPPAPAKKRHVQIQRDDRDAREIDDEMWRERASDRIPQLFDRGETLGDPLNRATADGL